MKAKFEHLVQARVAKVGVGRRVSFTHMGCIHSDAVTELYSYVQVSLPLLLYVLLTSKTHLQFA